MKTTIASLCIALGLTLGASTTALADHGYRGGYYDGPPRHHHHDGGYYRGSNWAGPAAVLAISGIVFFTAIGIHLWQWIREHGDES